MKDEVTSDAFDDLELVAVARVVRTRGLRGELVAELLTDFPDRFEGLERLIALMPSGQRESVKIEEYWLQSGRVVFKFAGFDSIEAATALIGCELTVPEDERVELTANEYYDWELTGCRVQNISGDYIGQVESVLHTGATDLLVVKRSGSTQEHLVPLADEICTEIDKEKKLILIDPPEGLLEL